MNTQVFIEDALGARRSVVLQGAGPFTIGRNPASSLMLDGDLVSRQHVRIGVRPQSLTVEDCSTNGTLAGGDLLRRDLAEVAYGTPIVVGTFRLVFEPSLETASDSTSPQPPAPERRETGSTVRALPEPARRALPSIAPPPPAPSLLPTPLPRLDHEDVRIDTASDADLRREIHRRLLEHLDLAQTEAARIDDPSFRPRVLIALRQIVASLASRLPNGTDRDLLIGEMADEALGLGPLEKFLADPTVSEIMVVDADTIYVEREGKLTLTGARFTDDERVRAVIERIITPLGRRIDESSPLVDARLKDGSRVNAIIRPLALRGSCITIRKFARTPLTLERMIALNTLSLPMARFLTRSVMAKKNIVISGGTGSGKTTLLNVLSSAIPAGERIITIEDAAELQLKQPHVVALETRPSNMEGKGEYTVRDLVRNALRMRPDRIVVGECRGGEALDMLQAMNTGHDGSLTTTHANSPEEAATRLETLALMAGVDLPPRAIREQIAKSIDLVVQQSRLPDGTRKVTEIAEVFGLDSNGEVDMRPIFRFVRSATGSSGEVLGAFTATGYLPTYLNDFVVNGMIKAGEPYL